MKYQQICKRLTEITGHSVPEDALRRFTHPSGSVDAPVILVNGKASLSGYSCRYSLDGFGARFRLDLPDGNPLNMITAQHICYKNKGTPDQAVVLALEALITVHHNPRLGLWTPNGEGYSTFYSNTY